MAAATARAKAGLAVAVAVLCLLAAAGGAAAACNPAPLAVCAPAITSGAAPSGACCAQLRGQQGCFCQYARNPAYSGYINSPYARKTAAACRVALPRC